MKRFTALFLLLGLLFSLTACNGAWIKDESLTVRDHVEQSMPEPAPTEEEQPPVVTGRNELRGAVLSFIRDWTEHGTILVRNYDGDISADLASLFSSFSLMIGQMPDNLLANAKQSFGDRQTIFW